MPVYKTVSAGLTVKEILDICVGQKVPEEKICQKVPSMIDRSAVFVVDLSVVNYQLTYQLTTLVFMVVIPAPRKL